MSHQFGRQSKYWEDLTRKCENCVRFNRFDEQGREYSYRTKQFESISPCIIYAENMNGGDICDDHDFLEGE